MVSTKQRHSLAQWVWFLCKVLIAAAVLGWVMSWLKQNIDSAAYWFVYPAAFLLWLSVSVPLVFNVPLRFLRSAGGQKRHDRDT